MKNHPKEKIRIPLWQAILLPLVTIVVFSLLFEGGLALFGVMPALQEDDPFVGFADNVPLFLPAQGPKGEVWMSTSPGKLNYFNPQKFPLKKAAGTYRIFTLGGSTTYGRPYYDDTSFSGWLRELLPLVEPQKKWEVINAGGISYASYRVAHLMEELVQYQPDLFIVYTGHNEFLEERTYGQVKRIPPVIRSTVSMMTKTRMWSAMSSGMEALGIHPQSKEDRRDRLSVEVDAILDRSVGLDRYTRNDSLQEKVLQHYRVSLERMVGLARSVGAEVVFVTPASSLNDCTPFKSEHTPGLEMAERQRAEHLLVTAKEALKKKEWQEALRLLEDGVQLDPRHAELQYRLGQALLGGGRIAEAESAFRKALDEDVCPLRALTATQTILNEVAEEQGVPVVDYVGLLADHMKDTWGYPIPGEELFLDHVHPTIEGHKLLSVELVEAMAAQGLVEPSESWKKRVLPIAAAQIESNIDAEGHGQALANLARVLLWAGKKEEAARLAQQAREIAGEYTQVHVDSALILSLIYVHAGEHERALNFLYSAVEEAPDAAELHLKVAEILMRAPFQHWEEAAAHLLLVCHYFPNQGLPHELFGISMLKRNLPEIAYPSLLEVVRLSPRKGAELQPVLEKIKQFSEKLNPRMPDIRVDYYPSHAPKRVAQVRQGSNGTFILDGLHVEFHENGHVKQLGLIRKGVKDGLEVKWNPEGGLISSVSYRNGKLL